MGYNKKEGFSLTPAKKKKTTTTKEETKLSYSLKDVQELPMIAVEHYGITKEAAKYFEIRSELCEKDGKTVTKTFFPYYSQKGELCGYKVRDWTKNKKEKFHITTVGDMSIGCKLFGQKQAEQVKRKKKHLIFVEGEGNVVAAWQALVDEVKGTKWEGKLDPFVVGLSHGTANAVAATSANEQFIREFEKDEEGKICLGFDNDQATLEEKESGIVKGWDAIEDVAGFLVSDKVFVYDYGEYNDPREFIMDGQGIALGKLLSFGQKKYHPEKIVSATDVSIEELLEPRPEGFYIDAFPELMKKIHGFRKQELVLVTAPSGAGKTTVVTEISHDLSDRHEQKIGKIYLEEIVKETILRSIARELKVNYNSSFKYNPLKVVSREKFVEAKKKIESKLMLIDHFGSIAVDVLIRKIKYLEHVCGCDFIILDHLSMVFSGTKTDDERKLVDILMTNLASYVASSDVGIIAVSHMKRKPFQFDLDPKTKEKLPTWIDIGKTDLRGSGALEQMAWIIIAVEPEILPNRERGRIRLTVLKNRPWSSEGECDILKMDNETGLFENAREEYDY